MELSYGTFALPLQNKRDLDVSNGGRISMLDHAKYRYLVHLDGQALSTRCGRGRAQCT